MLYPSFSTRIAEWWQVVDELTKLGKKLTLEVNPIQEDGLQTQIVKAIFDGKYAGMADSVPLAICKAALATIED